MSEMVGNELERPSTITPMLSAWARRRFGPDTDVGNLTRLPGHSGITFSFTVERGRHVVDRLVLKIPPLGVAQRNNTDVVRQVPVLEAMDREGVRVPAVRSSGTDEDGPFPVPHLIMEHVPGSPPGDIFAGPLEIGPNDVAAFFDEAVAELAAVHAVPWDPALRSWSDIRELRDEVDHWVPVLQKSSDERWVRMGMAVREHLLATMPKTQQTGIVHGDYYSNNWMFDAGSLTAVLDWENSTIGPQHIDIGWLCMMYDVDSWGLTRQAWMGTGPSPAWLLERYEHHAGRPVPHANWYRALAGYRLACLTAYYLRLHRTGRRVDPVWEVFGESFPYMLARAKDLLSPRGAGADES